MVKGFYNIYIKNNLLQIISSKDKAFIQLRDDHEIIDYDEDSENLMKAVNKLENNKLKRVVIHSNDIGKLWMHFTEIFVPVEAAGGIVFNDKDEILTMFRRKTWDLPKGKIEPLEKKKLAAIREVKEECGLVNVSIVSKLGNTYHTFGSKDKRKLKISCWYIMYSTDTKLQAQAEEDIEEVKWMSIDDFLSKAKPVFPNILDVVEAYRLKKTSL